MDELRVQIEVVSEHGDEGGVVEQLVQFVADCLVLQFSLQAGSVNLEAVFKVFSVFASGLFLIDGLLRRVFWIFF